MLEALEPFLVLDPILPRSGTSCQPMAKPRKCQPQAGRVANIVEKYVLSVIRHGISKGNGVFVIYVAVPDFLAAIFSIPSVAACVGEYGTACFVSLLAIFLSMRSSVYQGVAFVLTSA